MQQDFDQINWDDQVADDCRQLVRLAVREDLGRFHDITTLALVSQSARGAANMVARQSGVVAGLPAVALVFEEMNLSASWRQLAEEGATVPAGTPIAELSGATRDLLTAERLLLNLMGRLCGVATLTRCYVDAIQGTSARVYDTRKTTPGYRRLEKYAVRQGGGANHRCGLYDAVLIKDNHLAQAQKSEGSSTPSPRMGVQQARRFLQDSGNSKTMPLIEVEVDTLDQLDDALTAEPDIVLLDNMSLDELRQAVGRRDRAAPQVELEASGGITLAAIRQVAETGIERISVGALTHSAAALDVGLDWRD